MVPSFNEEQRLPTTLDRLTAWFSDLERSYEVVVVDDGSTDGTASMVAARMANHPELPLRLVGATHNRGKGAALATGFAAAHHELVLFLDADLPVPLETLVAMIDRCTTADLVVGSRRRHGASITASQPVTRRIGGWGFRKAAQLLGFRLSTDPQCGVKLLDRSSMSGVIATCTSERFAFDIELIERTRLAGLTFVEHPVSWHHVEGSSLRPVRDAVATLKDLVRLRKRLARSRIMADAKPRGTPSG